MRKDISDIFKISLAYLVNPGEASAGKYLQPHLPARLDYPFIYLEVVEEETKVSTYEIIGVNENDVDVIINMGLNKFIGEYND